MKRTRIYNIVISTLIILLLVGVYITQTGQKEDDSDIYTNISEFNGSYTTAKLTDKETETYNISLSEGLENISIDKGTEVIWNNENARSKIILVIEEQSNGEESPVFEKSVDGFSEISWLFLREGRYRYYVDDVNTTATIEVK